METKLLTFDTKGNPAIVKKSVWKPSKGSSSSSWIPVFDNAPIARHSHTKYNPITDTVELQIWMLGLETHTIWPFQEQKVPFTLPDEIVLTHGKNSIIGETSQINDVWCINIPALDEINTPVFITAVFIVNRL